MKRILYVLPLSMLLTYCSSTRPLMEPGVSNLKVNGEAATASTSAENQEWPYKETRDTALNGSWQLDGLMAADGSWKGADAWMPANTAAMDAMDSSAHAAMSSVEKSGETVSSSKTFGYKALDTSTHFFDTAAFRQTLAMRVKPFKYWERLPELNLMADLGIFTGSTGCNSMSGSFNFNGNDIKVDPMIRTSKMACFEYDENDFLNDLLKADNYSLNGNKLELKQGATTLLSFSRKEG